MNLERENVHLLVEVELYFSIETSESEAGERYLLIKTFFMGFYCNHENSKTSIFFEAAYANFGGNVCLTMFRGDPSILSVPLFCLSPLVLSLLSRPVCLSLFLSPLYLLSLSSCSFSSAVFEYRRNRVDRNPHIELTHTHTHRIYRQDTHQLTRLSTQPVVAYVKGLVCTYFRLTCWWTNEQGLPWSS